MIEITSRQEGFRRCGIAHSVTPKIYPNDKFSKKELLALQGEPMLTVRQVADGKSSEKTESKQQGGKAKVDEK